MRIALKQRKRADWQDGMSVVIGPGTTLHRSPTDICASDGLFWRYLIHLARSPDLAADRMLPDPYQPEHRLAPCLDSSQTLFGGGPRGTVYSRLNSCSTSFTSSPASFSCPLKWLKASRAWRDFSLWPRRA